MSSDYYLTTTAKNLRSPVQQGFRGLSPYGEIQSGVPTRKKTPFCVSFFVLVRFCSAKPVACGRVTEREWGNPSKVPPSQSPFLAVCRSADNKTCGQTQKSHSRQGMAFLRAEGGSIPRKITGHTLQAAQDDDTIPFTENKSVRSRRSRRPVMTRRQRFRVR